MQYSIIRNRRVWDGMSALNVFLNALLECAFIYVKMHFLGNEQIFPALLMKRFTFKEILSFWFFMRWVSANIKKNQKKIFMLQRYSYLKTNRDEVNFKVNYYIVSTFILHLIAHMTIQWQVLLGNSIFWEINLRIYFRDGFLKTEEKITSPWIQTRKNVNKNQINNSALPFSILYYDNESLLINVSISRTLNRMK